MNNVHPAFRQILERHVPVNGTVEDSKEPCVCYCGQFLFDCAIKCPSRAECHAENVILKQRLEAQARVESEMFPK